MSSPFLVGVQNKHVISKVGSSKLRLGEIHGISCPEEKRLQKVPDIGISPVLAQNIRWILNTWNVLEYHKSSSNSLSHIVEGEHVVPLMELPIRDGRALDHRIVVFKHAGAFVDWDSAATQHSAWVSDLFSTETSSNEFRTVRGSFGRVLFLGESFNRCLVEVM